MLSQEAINTLFRDNPSEQSLDLTQQVGKAIHIAISNRYGEITILDAIHTLLEEGSREVWKNPDGSIVGLENKIDGAKMIVKMDENDPCPTLLELEKAFGSARRMRTSDISRENIALFNTPMGQQSPTYTQDMYTV